MRKLKQKFLITIISLFFFLKLTTNVDAKENIKIGVLAKRGNEQAQEQWGETANYLSENITNYSFEIIPLDFTEIYSAVENKEVEFILTNPAIYVELEVNYGVNRIATLKNLSLGEGYSEFAGVIFVKANSSYNSFQDLEGTIFGAVEENSLGGYQMAKGEFIEEGINPEEFFTEIKFLGTHDDVVYAVLDETLTVGTVRSDTLERMEQEGKIDLDEIKVLHVEEKDHNATDFPFLHSTNLYPEWPIAKVEHTDEDLATEVAYTLMQMPADSIAAQNSLISGWTVPANYQSVHELLRQIKASPYGNYGEISFLEFIKQNLLWVSIIIFFIVAILISLIQIAQINRHLKNEKSQIDRLNRILQITNKILRHDLANKFGGIARAYEIYKNDNDSQFLDEAYLKAKDGIDLIAQMRELENLIKIQEEMKVYSLREEVTNASEDIKIPITIEGDAQIYADSAIESIFDNILENAVRHSKTDKIKITIEKQGDKTIIQFKDFGLGIKDEIKEKIFKEGFSYGESAGSGLGLYIVKETIERYGGTIEVLDNKPKGAIFKITLPRL